MRQILAVACVAILAALPAEAQHGLAFTKHVVTRDEYATALKQNDQKVLNVDCGQIAGSVAAHTKTSIRSCADLSEYVGRLQVLQCPKVDRDVHLGRVVNHAVDDAHWARRFKPGEVCLYDNNEARWMFSLSCGNDIVDSDLPVESAMKQVVGPRAEVKAEAKAEVRAGPVAASAEAHTTTTAAVSTREMKECGVFRCHATAWVVGTAVVVTGALLERKYHWIENVFDTGPKQTQSVGVVVINGNRVGAGMNVRF